MQGVVLITLLLAFVPYLFAQVEYQGHTYTLYETKVNFSTAVAFTTNGGYLVTITSQGEQDFIRSTFPGVEFWIGGADYYLKTELGGTGYFSWHSVTSPEYMFCFYDQHNQSCVYDQYCNMNYTGPVSQRGLLFKNGNWIPMPYNHTAFYLLETGGTIPSETVGLTIFNPITKHYYSYVPATSATDYAGAKSAAAIATHNGEHGYLATITTPYEWNFIKTQWGAFVHVYAAGTDQDIEGQWRWDSKETFIFYNNGTSVDFHMWAPPEPNNSGGNENALQILWGGWNDMPSTTLLGYIVEYDCTREISCGGHGECNSAGTCNCDNGFSGNDCKSCSFSQSTYPACFILNPENGHYYALVPEAKDFTNAMLHAFGTNLLLPNKTQGYLASITSDSEGDFVRQNFGSNFWIGGVTWNHTGYWAWVGIPDRMVVFYDRNENRCINETYCNFADFRPEPVQEAGLIFNTNKKWTEVDTKYTYPFLIEVGGDFLFTNHTKVVYNPNNKHFYEFVAKFNNYSTGLDIVNSRMLNSSIPAYFATITSPEESNFLFNSLGYFTAFLGANDLEEEGTWKWTGDDAFNQVFTIKGRGCFGFCLWRPIEPNNVGVNGEHVLSIENLIGNEGLFGIWNDLPVESVNAVLVEYECRTTICNYHGDCNSAGQCVCDYGFADNNCSSCAFSTSLNYPLCDIFPKMNPENGHHYLLVENSVNFTSALAGATNYKFGEFTGYLATVTTPSENEFLVRNVITSSIAWVSGTDFSGTGYWIWYSGPEQSYTFYDEHTSLCVQGMFCNFSPIGQSAKRGLSISSDGIWASSDYMSAHYYVIEFNNTKATQENTIFNNENNRYYSFTGTAMNWTSATKFAQSQNYNYMPGNLVALNSPYESNLVLSMIRNYSTYIGATKNNGVWSWGAPGNETLYTSECVGFCLFGPSQPSSGSVLQVGSNRMWESVDGSSLSPFIIEYACQPTVTCSGHGVCVNESCVCYPEFNGTRCNSCTEDFYGYPNCLKCLANENCTGNGICNVTNAQCICNYGFQGSKCDHCSPNHYSPSCIYCEDSMCNNNGRCGSLTGLCECSNEGLDKSANCSICLPNHYNYPNCTYCDGELCHYHGSCSNSTGLCDCFPEFSGQESENCSGCPHNHYNHPYCTYCSASESCHGNGTCGVIDGLCRCFSGFNASTNCSTCELNHYGFSCSYCGPDTCHLHGTCNSEGRCKCDTGFEPASNCSTCAVHYYQSSCSQYCNETTCNSHGKCNNVTGLCDCDSGFASSSNCDSCQPNYYHYPSCLVAEGPSEPVNVSSITTRFNSTLYWHNPLSNGTFSIIGSVVEYFNVSRWVVIYNGTKNSIDIINLAPGSVHQFIIYAFNSVKNGSYSYHNATTKELASPSRLESPKVVKYTRDTIDLSFSAPSDDGGIPVLFYTLFMTLLDNNNNNNLARALLSKTTNFTIYNSYQYHVRNLTVNSNYSFVISAYNSLGYGEPSPVLYTATAPVLCGDIVCDFTESCSSCFSDCGACGYAPCPSGCNGRGGCIKGVCECVGGWSGDACQYSVQPPVVVVVNNTSPSTQIGLDGDDKQNSGGVNFQISFNSIREVSSSSEIIDSYDLQLQNVTFANFSNSIGAQLSYLYLIELPNKAAINISIFFFDAPTTVLFAGQNIQMAKNGMKYTMNITNWPFTSISNHMEISMTAIVDSISGNYCQSTSSVVDDSSNLRSILIGLRGVTLYGQFAESIYKDGDISRASFAYNSPLQRVDITVPHFWDYVEFDPNFQVLLDPAGVSTDCEGAVKSKSGVNGAVIGGVIGGILAAAIIGAIIVYLALQRRKRVRMGSSRRQSIKMSKINSHTSLSHSESASSI